MPQPPLTPEPRNHHDDGEEDDEQNQERRGEDIYEGDPRLSPLEAQVLSEWARLRSNLDILANQLQTLSAQPSSLISDNLRLLERKTTLVCTALKSSVYSIVLSDQEGLRGDGEGGV